jgi:hypothetical protein
MLTNQQRMQRMSDADSFESRTSDVGDEDLSERYLPKLRIGSVAARKGDPLLHLLDHVPFTPSQGVRTPSPRSPAVRPRACEVDGCCIYQARVQVCSVHLLLQVISASTDTSCAPLIHVIVNQLKHRSHSVCSTAVSLWHGRTRCTLTNERSSSCQAVLRHVSLSNPASLCVQLPNLTGSFIRRRTHGYASAATDEESPTSLKCLAMQQDESLGAGRASLTAQTATSSWLNNPAFNSAAFKAHSDAESAVSQEPRLCAAGASQQKRQMHQLEGLPFAAFPPDAASAHLAAALHHDSLLGRQQGAAARSHPPPAPPDAGQSSHPVQVRHSRDRAQRRTHVPASLACFAHTSRLACSLL